MVSRRNTTDRAKNLRTVYFMLELDDECKIIKNF